MSLVVLALDLELLSAGVEVRPETPADALDNRFSARTILEFNYLLPSLLPGALLGEFSKPSAFSQQLLTD
jgi:hypothetical protein